MKTAFIEVKSRLDFLDKLKPNKDFCLVTTVQYKEQAKRFPYHAFVLGCNVIPAKRFENKVEKFICTDRFHALQLALSVKKPVFFYKENISAVAEKMKKKRKANLIKLLSQNKVGIIVSTKQGQEQLEKAEKIREKLLKKGKNAFIFLSETINPSEIENFACSFINTACSGLALDIPFVNSDDVEGFL